MTINLKPMTTPAAANEQVLRQFVDELQTNIRLIAAQLNAAATSSPGQPVGGTMTYVESLSRRIELRNGGTVVRLFARTLHFLDGKLVGISTEHPAGQFPVGAAASSSASIGGASATRGTVAMLQTPGAYLYHLDTAAGDADHVIVKVYNGGIALGTGAVTIYYLVTDTEGVTALSSNTAVLIATEGEVETWSDVADGFTPAAGDATVQVGIGVSDGIAEIFYPFEDADAVDWTQAPVIPVDIRPNASGVYFIGLGTSGL